MSPVGDLVGSFVADNGLPIFDVDSGRDSGDSHGRLESKACGNLPGRPHAFSFCTQYGTYHQDLLAAIKEKAREALTLHAPAYPTHTPRTHHLGALPSHPPFTLTHSAYSATLTLLYLDLSPRPR